MAPQINEVKNSISDMFSAFKKRFKQFPSAMEKFTSPSLFLYIS